MGIGNLQEFKHTLNSAVFAIRPMQGIEGDIRLQLSQHGTDIAVHIHPRDLVAFRLQRIRTINTGRKRDHPLRRPSAHQYGNVFSTHFNSPQQTGFTASANNTA